MYRHYENCDLQLRSSHRDTAQISVLACGAISKIQQTFYVGMMPSWSYSVPPLESHKYPHFKPFWVPSCPIPTQWYPTSSWNASLETVDGTVKFFFLLFLKRFLKSNFSKLAKVTAIFDSIL